MKTYLAVLFSPHEAHRQAAPQFSACGFIANSTIESGAENMKFCFRHDALQSEHQPIIKNRRMVETVAIPDESIGDAAEIEEAVPVSIVARHARDFQGEHDADVAERHFRGQACEAGTLRESGAGHTQVFVDDGHLFLGPTQLTSFDDQSILASRGFAVGLDLRRAGLANVDESCPLDMTGFYFARIIHDSLRSPRCLERPG